ncbi:hypothetical protein [Nonomuraea sp. NPDC005650]|uniref:hypothetical protein n=1 Tax=Nonomuraea sp. NPDC005650 TaxID=3157045 RepID=UPI0033B5DA85
MTTTHWPVFSPFARQHFGRGLEEGRTKGIAEGKVEGKAEGKAEGMAEGKAEGKAEEAARIVLLLLTNRGLDVPDDTRAQITATTDLTQLETWVTRAATAHTLRDLFSDTDEQLRPN